MGEWETPQGGAVEVLATGIYIEGEFLEDRIKDNAHE